VFQDAASALFGVEGLRVADVQAGPGGAVEVWTVTDWPAAAACPDCGTVSSRLHETVVTRPRDVRRAGDPVDLRWVKRRWKCAAEACTCFHPQDVHGMAAGRAATVPDHQAAAGAGRQRGR